MVYNNYWFFNWKIFYIYFKGEKMKDNIKHAGSLFLRIVIVNFLCAVVVLSISGIIAPNLFGEPQGYIVVGVKDGKDEYLYEHYFADGEDTKKAEYEKQGYEIVEKNMPKELDKKGNIITYIVAQFLCLMLLGSFVYGRLWDLGSGDSNLVSFNHKTENKLRGFIIGGLTVIPAVLLLLFMLITKNSICSDVPLAIYKFLNSSIFGFLELASGTTSTFGNLPIIRGIAMFVPQITVPVLAGVSYILGYKHISIGELLVYKKDKKQNRSL